MIKILVIDDERVFRPERDGVTYCRTADEALALMENGRPEIETLCLDHDLGTNAAGETIDIMPVINFLKHCADDGNPYPVYQIIVVTMNNVMVQTMVEVLQARYEIVQRALPTTIGLVKT